MSDINEIDINIEQSKGLIERAEAVVRLTKNADFKNLILEGYFKEEAAKLVMLLGDYTQQDPDNQALLMNEIRAISGLSNYMRGVTMLGRQAKKALVEDSQTKEELIEEEG